MSSKEVVGLDQSRFLHARRCYDDQIIVILPLISKNYLLNLWSTSGDQVYAKDDVVATSSEGVCDEFQVVSLVKIQELGRRETIVNINMNQSFALSQLYHRVISTAQMA